WEFYADDGSEFEDSDEEFDRMFTQTNQWLNYYSFDDSLYLERTGDGHGVLVHEPSGKTTLFERDNFRDTIDLFISINNLLLTHRPIRPPGWRVEGDDATVT